MTAPTMTAAKRERRTRFPRPQWHQILLSTVLAAGGILMVGPFYWGLVTSFKSREEILAFPPTWWPTKPTLEHWIGLTNLRIGSFEIFFRNSLFVAITVTLLTLLTSSMAGYVFAKYAFRGRDALFVGILSMLMIPFNISIIPLYALMLDLNWTNSFWALIIPSAFSPFGIFLMRQFMHSIPDELIDAARIDGASEFGIFFRIVLPLSTAALGALAIFIFVAQWDDFLWPLVIIDEPALYTLPLGLAQFRGRVGTNVGGLAAGSMLAVIPVLIVYFIAQRRFIEGIAMTGLKG
jgi:ABC-type glycerol-3-phosphate transport system permease component